MGVVEETRSRRRALARLCNGGGEVRVRPGRLKEGEAGQDGGSGWMAQGRWGDRELSAGAHKCRCSATLTPGWASLSTTSCSRRTATTL